MEIEIKLKLNVEHFLLEDFTENETGIQPKKTNV